VYGQDDPNLSQFHKSLVLINPATTGAFYGSFRIGSHYRTQYTQASTQPYVTQVVTADMPILKDLFGRDLLGVGIVVHQNADGLSSLTTQRAGLNVSYGKALDYKERHFLSIGYNASFFQRSANLDDLNWGAQWDVTDFDPTLPSLENTNRNASDWIDMGAGVNYFFSDQDHVKGMVGLSTEHFLTPSIDFLGREEKMLRRYNFHAELDFFNDVLNVSTEPKLYMMFQGANFMSIFGSNFNFLLSEAGQLTNVKREISLDLGLYYRWREGIIPQLGFNLGGFSFGASYDVGVSKINKITAAQGGLEFYLAFKAGYKKGVHEGHSNDRFDRIR